LTRKRHNVKDTAFDEPAAAMDAHWAREAQDRLAAYLRGEIQAICLADVIAKY
jgi:hypothetical protein